MSNVATAHCASISGPSTHEELIIKAIQVYLGDYHNVGVHQGLGLLTPPIPLSSNPKWAWLPELKFRDVLRLFSVLKIEPEQGIFSHGGCGALVAWERRMLDNEFQSYISDLPHVCHHVLTPSRIKQARGMGYPSDI